MITSEQLQHWRALAEAATPGPWEGESVWSDDSDSYYVAVADGRGLLDTYISISDADAAFIAAARTAVPALLAEVERLQAVIAYIDARAPLADATCAEPGITLSEAARRALAQMQPHTTPAE
jgi:hypothetical protein